jgi:hypothetical protein
MVLFENPRSLENNPGDPRTSGDDPPVQEPVPPITENPSEPETRSPADVPQEEERTTA